MSTIDNATDAAEALEMLQELTGTTPDDHGGPVEEMAAVRELEEQYSGAEEPQKSHPSIGDIRITLAPHHEGLPLPEYQSVLASGFDLIAANDDPIYLNTIGASAMIPTGINVEVPVGFELQVRPRSGLAAKHGITVTNTPGTVDADYRGEVSVLLTNLKGGRFTIERGMRIAQAVICPVVQGRLVVVDSLSDTERGTGAFGSTGVV